MDPPPLLVSRCTKHFQKRSVCDDASRHAREGGGAQQHLGVLGLARIPYLQNRGRDVLGALAFILDREVVRAPDDVWG